MNLRPVTREEWRHFIAKHHRHRDAPPQIIAAVGIEQDGELVGVGTLERPKAEGLCDGRTAEASRVCTLGARNGCSMLYGALARAAAALGYTRLVTYTREGEPGASLRGAGFHEVARTPVREWSEERHAQPELLATGRLERAPVPRVRWERAL